jgi:Zn-dependent peptidase ImmA (M78 family)
VEETNAHGFIIMVQVYANPEMLKWARELRRFTLKHAARKLKLRRAALLQEYEDGSRQLNMGLLEDIAKTYSVPTATLMLESPPAMPKIPKDFRTVLGRPAELLPETLIMISRIRAYQQKLAELREIDPEFAVVIPPTYKMQGDVGKLGERERHRIGISVDEQLSWRGADVAFRKWRRAIEEQGVYVYMEKFDYDDCKGISLIDHNDLPCLIVNKNEPTKVGQIFSLIHEYAHILFRRPGMSDRDFANSTEASCNRFAASFLIPREALAETLPYWPSGPVDWKQSDVVNAAGQLKVSQQATALRLEEIGLAPRGFFSRFKDTQGVASRRKKAGRIPPYTIQRAYDLGRRFPSAILSAAGRGVISKVDAATILNTPEHLLHKLHSDVSI